jgi:hypothetical protein
MTTTPEPDACCAGTSMYGECICPWDEPESVERDTAGWITRGPSLPCGCPLDSGCDSYH